MLGAGRRNGRSDIQYSLVPNTHLPSLEHPKNGGTTPLLHDLSSGEEEAEETTLFEMQYTEENGNVARKKVTFSVEEAVESLGLGWFQFRLFIVCGIITAADALEMLLLAFLAPFVRCEWGLEETQVAAITTVVFAGMCVFAPLWGWFGDHFGRKTALISMVVWIAYFGLLTVFSPVYTWILILRALVGGGMAGSPQGFALLAEYIPSKGRAKLLMSGQIFWALGAIFEVVLAAVVVPRLGWRWLVGLSAVPICFAGLLLFFVPESARYLVLAGKTDAAMKELQAAAALNKNSLPPGEVGSVSATQVSRGRFIDLFSREYLRSTLQIWMLWFTAAFTYYGMLLASAEILRSDSSEAKSKCKCQYMTYDDYVSMILSTLGEFAALPILFLLIDRFGRKISGFVTLFTTGFFAILLQIKANHWVLTTFMFIVRGMSGIVFTFVYIYTSEVYPTSVRTLGLGTASSWARVGAMITPFIAQVLLSVSQTAAVCVYGTLCILCALNCLFLPIETKGRAMPQTVTWKELEEVAAAEDLESS